MRGRAASRFAKHDAGQRPGSSALLLKVSYLVNDATALCRGGSRLLLTNRFWNGFRMPLVSLERVIERLGWCDDPRLVSDGDCQDANSVVVWQRQRASACW